MISKKMFASLLALAVCILLYQNCATTSYQSLREVNLKSPTVIDLLDNNGQKFLTWNFTPGIETRVKISSSDKEFCERIFILNKAFETKWSYLLKSINSGRSNASEKGQVFKIKLDKKEFNVSGESSKKIFALMEDTKLNHTLNVSNCNTKAWGFKNITIEGLTLTDKKSKFLQIISLNVLGGNAAETVVKEEPVEIALNSKDIFCDYTFREYNNNSTMLNVMFAANELKSMNENNTRGLASLTESSEGSDNLLVTIDGTEKIIAPAGSELSANIRRFVNNIKSSPKTRKSCSYSY